MKACRGWEGERERQRGRDREGMAQGQGEAGTGLGVAGDGEICCWRNVPNDGREEGKHRKW